MSEPDSPDQMEPGIQGETRAIRGIDGPYGDPPDPPDPMAPIEVSGGMGTLVPYRVIDDPELYYRFVPKDRETARRLLMRALGTDEQ